MFNLKLQKILGVLALVSVLSVGGRTWAADSTITYGSDPQQKLDICQPTVTKSLAPAVLMIHGGAWRSGSRSALRKICSDFAQKGIVAVPVDYRLAQGTVATRWPVQFNDVQLAMRWLRAHAGEYGIDSNHICAEGDSAGGQLALLLGAVATIDHGDNETFLSTISPRANCVISISGPTNLVELDKEKPGYTSFLMGPDNSQNIQTLQTSASPLLRLQRGMPPVLFIHGIDDPVVPYSQSLDMFQALTALGTPAWLISHPGGHELNGLVGRQDQNVWALIASFVASNEISGPPRQLSIDEAVGDGR